MANRPPCGSPPADMTAFPGAEGFGQFAKGGRGGRVIKVTNLNDAGPGSLRAAVEAEGPRIVVFDVGGVIQLKSDLRIANDYITIAGQTAPGYGITLRDGQFLIHANHVIVRYLRSRVGDEAGKENDSISIGGGSDIILDHISSGWSIDESLSVTQKVTPEVKHLTNVTVQWSLISESLNHSIHEKGEHGYGSLIQGSYGAKYSFHHNLWAHHEARMPRIGNYAGAKDDAEGIVLDFRDNVFYNWGQGATTDFYNWEPGVSRGYAMDPFYGRPDNASKFAAGEDLNTNANTHSNFVNNYYIQGFNTGGPLALYIRNKSGKTYFSGNWMDGKLVADQKSLVLASTAAPGEHVMSSPSRSARSLPSPPTKPIAWCSTRPAPPRPATRSTPAWSRASATTRQDHQQPEGGRRLVHGLLDRRAQGQRRRRHARRLGDRPQAEPQGSVGRVQGSRRRRLHEHRGVRERPGEITRRRQLAGWALAHPA
jgi:hypothetical protein